MGRNNARAFTLLELIITIAAVAVLLATAVPPWREIVQQNRLAAAVNDLVSALQFAKSEAMKRNRSIVVVADSQGWVKGWKVKVNANDTTALRDYGALAANASISATGGSTQVVFSGLGVARSGADTYSVTLPNAREKGCVVVESAGLIQATKIASSSNCP